MWSNITNLPLQLTRCPAPHTISERRNFLWTSDLATLNHPIPPPNTKLELLMENLNIAETSLKTGRLPSRYILSHISGYSQLIHLLTKAKV